MSPLRLVLLGSVASACLAAGVRDPAAAAPPVAPGDVRLERALVAMGTGLVVEVRAGDRATALAASEAAVRAVEAAEARLSTWRDDTELARLNATPVGEVVAVSPLLERDLAGARAAMERTGGAFDPGVGTLVRAWGLRKGGRRPSDAELETARAGATLAGLELAAGRATRREAGLVVEEGGFGKGAGLADALAAAREAGASALVVDLGGQVASFGEEVRWGVADPRDRDRAVLELRFDGGSVATSGNAERAVVVDGERLGHLLDPRTGRPAPDFGSVSVWASDPLEADALATGLFVMGPRAALDWGARQEPPVPVLVLEPRPEGLVATATAPWRGRLTPLVPELELRFHGDPPATE